MAHIGFSTGSMHNSYFPIEERAKMFKAAGANAIELSFGTPCALKDYKITDEFLETLSSYELVTIHAPWKDGVRYDGNSSTIVDKLKEICSVQKIYGIVLHPNTVDDYSLLEKSGLPFLIENMDNKARCGTRPQEFEKLKKDYNFGFVLDLQHAYMHDPAMQLAGEIIEAMGDNIREFHASGQLKNNTHTLLHQSENSKIITSLLRNDLPIILEGKITGNINNEAEEEISLMKRILSA
ncbi:MAG: hypothetical protein PHO02_02300 [Candidatus Nanoarchaeia archaeon]|nr:hypothetical protein [Candidatus Nanoarchaeia archaeon]